MEEKILAQLKGRWDRLIKEGQEMTFREGQVLFYEGHTPYGLFVLKSGGVRFEKGKIPCKEEHLKPSPQGKVLGLDHFFSSTPFCCTCVCQSDCELVFISKSQLQTVVAD